MPNTNIFSCGLERLEKLEEKNNLRKLGKNGMAKLIIAYRWHISTIAFVFRNGPVPAWARIFAFKWAKFLYKIITFHHWSIINGVCVLCVCKNCTSTVSKSMCKYTKQRPKLPAHLFFHVVYCFILHFFFHLINIIFIAIHELKTECKNSFFSSNVTIVRNGCYCFMGSAVLEL